MPSLRQRVAVCVVRWVQQIGAKRVRVAGREFEVTADVFNPKFFQTSKMLAAHLEVAPGERVLDVGTGSGIQAIIAAARAREVIGIDINPAAVRCAEENARRNGVDNVAFLLGDLFAPLTAEARFDLIVFNPPYMEGEAREPFEHALYDPGGQIIERFLSTASQHLAPGGRVLLLYSTIADHDRLLARFDANGWEHSVVAHQRSLIETYMIHRLTRGPAIAR